MPPKKPTIYKTGNKPPTTYKTGNKPQENIYSTPTAEMAGLVEKKSPAALKKAVKNKSPEDLKKMYVQASTLSQVVGQEMNNRGINKPKVATSKSSSQSGRKSSTGKAKVATPKQSPQSSPKPELKARKNPTIPPRRKKQNLAFQEEK